MPEETKPAETPAINTEATQPTAPQTAQESIVVAQKDNKHLVWIMSIVLVILVAVVTAFAYSQGLFNQSSPETQQTTEQTSTAESTEVEQELTNLDSELGSLDSELSELEKEGATF